MKQDYTAIPSDTLRALAEKADGRRGIAQTIVRIGKGRKVRYDVLTKDEMAELTQKGEKVEPLLPVDARHRTAARAKHERETVVTLTVPGGKPHTYTAAEVDALFLTEAAVEKFVLPYYARSLPPAEYAALVKRYYDEDKVAWAMIHYPPTQYHFVEAE